MSFDSPEDNAAFAEKSNFNFPLLSDTDRAMGMAYGACTDPGAGYAKRISVLIDANGNVEQVIDPVDPKAHPGSVLSSL